MFENHLNHMQEKVCESLRLLLVGFHLSFSVQTWSSVMKENCPRTREIWISMLQSTKIALWRVNFWFFWYAHCDIWVISPTKCLLTWLHLLFATDLLKIAFSHNLFSSTGIFITAIATVFFDIFPGFCSKLLLEHWSRLLYWYFNFKFLGTKVPFPVNLLYSAGGLCKFYSSQWWACEIVSFFISSLLL